MPFCGVVLALTLSWPLAAGCSAPHAKPQGAALAPSPQPYDADIPVPEGFRLVENSCEDWAAGPIRYLRHRYRGRADKLAVRRFYRDQMPLVRWAAAGDGGVHGRYTMRFERGTESCTITIDEAHGPFGRVTVDVLVTPARR